MNARPSPLLVSALALLVGLASGRLGSLPAAQAQTNATKAKKPTPNAPAVAPAAAAPAPAAAAAGPMEQLKKSNADLKRLIQRRNPSWSPEAELKNKDVKKVVEGLLDFDELARRALAKHWDKLKPAERAEFVSTLQQLVERNYLKQMYGQPDYEMTFKKEEVTGDEALVNSVLTAKRRGKKVDMTIDYKLTRKGSRWVVYDIVTDDLSLLENYRAEFNKVINKEGFAALMGRMKKKLGERG